MSNATLNLVHPPTVRQEYSQTVLRELADTNDWKELVNICYLSIDFIREFKNKIRWDWQYYALIYMWRHKDDSDLFANKKTIESFFKEFREQINYCEEKFGEKIPCRE